MLAGTTGGAARRERGPPGLGWLPPAHSPPETLKPMLRGGGSVYKLGCKWIIGLGGPGKISDSIGEESATTPNEEAQSQAFQRGPRGQRRSYVRISFVLPFPRLNFGCIHRREEREKNERAPLISSP
jgi:hypothetical protein